MLRASCGKETRKKTSLGTVKTRVGVLDAADVSVAIAVELVLCGRFGELEHMGQIGRMAKVSG